MESTKVKILDLQFSNKTKKEVLDLLSERVKKDLKTFIITANAEIAMYARQNKEYLKIANKADLIVPDGIGVVKGAKILKEYIPERIPGIELMADLLEYADKNEKKVYFYGAKPEVIEAMVEILKQKYKSLDIVGYHHGYTDDKDNKISNEVTRLKPDYIFVAKGCPLQDEWIIKTMSMVNKGVFMGVGGSFDVMSGNAKRAPKIWIDMNLEWLYRVLSNPSRIGRYGALPRFVVEVYKDRRRS